MGAAWTEAERDALKAALASGILTVSYAGPPARTITYQSLSAMRSLLSAMNAQLGDDDPPPRVRYAKHSKGF